MKSLFLWIGISVSIVVVTVATIWFLQVMGMLVEGIIGAAVFVTASYLWRVLQWAVRSKSK